MENFEKSERQKRIDELEKLKQELLILTSQNDNNSNFNENDNANTNNRSQDKGKSFSLSTSVGRKMSNEESGFSNVFMLAIISLVCELIFLGIAFLIYR